jgi:tungstate transport system permease protein
MLAPELPEILGVTLRVSGAATLLAALASVPLGLVLALASFPGKRAVVTLVHTLMALPTVVVGLLLYGLLSRSGPLGFLELLYTPWAMIAGQFLLALPVITALTYSAVAGVDPRVRRTALTLGATELQAGRTLLREARFGMLAAVAAGFGRAITEIGAAMMLGGNIRGLTRTITTAITMETAKGDFALGLALGLILLAVALGANALLAFALRARE